MIEIYFSATKDDVQIKLQPPGLSALQTHLQRVNTHTLTKWTHSDSITYIWLAFVRKAEITQKQSPLAHTLAHMHLHTDTRKTHTLSPYHHGHS